MFDNIIAKLKAGMTWREIEEERKRERQERGEVWLETNEIEEFICCLEHTSFFSCRIISEVNWWRWVVIALHSAVQGACVCAIRGSDTSGVKVLEGSLKDRKVIWLVYGDGFVLKGTKIARRSARKRS